MTSPVRVFAQISVLARTLLLKWLAFARRSPRVSPDPQVSTNPLLPEAASRFAKRHRKILGSLGLEVDARGLLLRTHQRFSERGVEIELTGEAKTELNFASVQTLKGAALRSTLSEVQQDLAAKTRFALEQAQGTLWALIDLALREDELRWLGGEANVRKRYLSFPEHLGAHEATQLAGRRHKDVQASVAKAKQDFLIGKLRKFTKARLDGKNLSQRYLESFPFLSTLLELECHIEKTLEHRQIERLLRESDTGFAAAIDTVLAGPRKALLARVGDQLADLERRVRDLPHVELLSDDEIATTVAPYYGGLNRSLKRRRAKSALVAVEERAREAKYVDDVNKLNEQRAAFADVASYYPLARSLQRQLVLYVGPTNSGKTWRSLNDLADAGSGTYLAPLRLLALEGQEELEKRGKVTSFLTGEERDIKPDACFISSTIEMLDLERQVDAVVIDEVQLLADERRGWAWLAAVLGAPAKKVIMTGSPDCVPIVKDLAQYLGEELIVHECQRHNELRVAPSPIRLKDIRPGTAVVCFSRRDVLRLKSSIQEHTEHKVAVVYGNLSPQVRREEARRFRTGEADVLVATDAIAMGLNLPITEVLFYTIEKFNGEQTVVLTPSEIRQIGGRAGRHGFAAFGVVNAMDTKSLETIREAIKGTSEPLQPPFYVAPGPNHIRIISQVLQTSSLERILTFFERAIEFSDERFTRSNIDDLSYLSTYVDEQLPYLEVTERLTIASAPVGIRNETVLNWFIYRMLKAFPDPNYPDEAPDALHDLFQEADRFNKEAASSQLELRDAEDYLKTLSVYAWLAFRYPGVFTRIDECEWRREMVNAFVERSLKSVPAKRCVACDVKLPADFKHAICDACHAKDLGPKKSRRRRRKRSDGGSGVAAAQQASGDAPREADRGRRRSRGRT